MTGSVLVPLDGSEVSEAALEYAVETFPGAEVTVLHVVEVVMPAVSGIGTVVDETVQQENEQRAESIADRAQTVSRDAGFDGELRFVTDAGTPALSIVDHAVDVDAIVMGSHGRHGASRPPVRQRGGDGGLSGSGSGDDRPLTRCNRSGARQRIRRRVLCDPANTWAKITEDATGGRPDETE